MSTFIAYATSECAVFGPEWTESDSKLILSAKEKETLVALISKCAPRKTLVKRMCRIFDYRPPVYHHNLLLLDYKDKASVICLIKNIKPSTD